MCVTPELTGHVTFAALKLAIPKNAHVYSHESHTLFQMWYSCNGNENKCNKWSTITFIRSIG